MNNINWTRNELEKAGTFYVSMSMFWQVIQRHVLYAILFELLTKEIVNL